MRFSGDIKVRVERARFEVKGTGLLINCHANIALMSVIYPAPS